MAQRKNYSYSIEGSTAGKIKEINERYALTIGDIAGVLDVTSKTVSRWTRQKNPGFISTQKSDSLRILESI